MAPAGHEMLWDAIRRIDATMRMLSQFAIDLSRPGVLERMRARAGEMRRQQAELEETQREADRWLPEMLDLYRNGSDADRRQMRDFLAVHRSFRWGFGWGLIGRIATAEDARNVLAVFSMKDGGGDWRDQIVAHDHLCAAMQRAGLPVAALLAEAAGWSSDISRFANARSTRALLLDYANRFGG
jgi:hypothetical protein